jgi:membrane-bound lytic murein transglycosylase D
MWILVIFGTIFESICEGNWIYLFFQLNIKLMYRYIYLLFVVCLSAVYTLNGQSLMTKSDNELLARIAQIDTATVKLRNNRLFPVVNQGDLNIYGYNEEDVPVFSDSAYAYRLSLLETEVPLEYNEYVKSYIDLYAFRRRKLVSKVLAQSRHYFPVFEEIFDRENIPLEMKYLAVIESALNQNAVSPVGATGMWQFMAPTGRIFGLRTDHALDERRDLIRSTEAAVKYFKNSYKIYGDWLLVIASYNCGPGNVNKAIKRSGGKRNFWEIMPYLPRETRGYVPAFIAAAYVVNYASEHNIYPADIEINPYLDTILVDNRMSIEQLALGLQVSPSALKAWNPSFKKGYIPFSPNKVVLNLPYHHLVKLVELTNDSAYNESSQQALAQLSNEINEARSSSGIKTKLRHKVKAGENLAQLAQKYDVSIAQIKKWNRGKIKHNRINKGQTILIKTEKA